jgi:hypothetical protein
MTPHNGTPAPEPPKDEKLVEAPKPERGVWLVVRVGPEFDARAIADARSAE